MDLVGNTGLHVEMVLWGFSLLDNTILSSSPMNWLVSQIQWLMAALARLLTMELFQLGGRGISLSLLVQMVTVVLVALLTARLIKRWIHARILARVISDLGSREAIATVLGYVLSISSVLLALQLIGINLSSLTVLLGTVGIGLGFALKTIASNFLSGIVLLFERPIKLFERPIKVGDFRTYALAMNFLDFGRAARAKSSNCVSPMGMDISALPTGQMLPTLRDMLRRINYFEHCTDSELRQLIEDGFRQTVSAGEMIFQEDAPCDCFYIILAGSVEIFSHRTGVHIANRFVGDFFGEMSLLMGVPRLASVRALEETVLFVITQDNLQCVLKHHKELADDISQELVKRQDILRQLGLLATAPMDEETPIVWIRRRMQAIFGI